MSILGNILRLICVVIGLVLVSAFVGLFMNGVQLDMGLYIDSVIHIIYALIHPRNLVFIGPTGFEYSIFINFWDYYFYSITIFLTALLISMFIAVLISYVTTLLPKKINLFIVKIASLLESIPDLLIIIVIQFCALYYYKQTGTKLFSIIGTSQDKTYFLPIIALSLIPSLMIFKVILYLVNDELEKAYVHFAKNKGFSRTHIFFSHVLRNITPSIIIHSKSVILILLSSMVIFEKLFNIYGIFTFITKYSQPEIIAFTLVMIYLPIFIVYTLLTEVIFRKTGQRLEW
ncbi:ABC transporter permease subunit [Psychrobacillus sp. BM2]|uniref:ABC transporter permease subunit n=1 Tax=Psychrobacillus sp. BM2 TaxID=3400421 RepID=UPI003B01EDE5